MEAKVWNVALTMDDLTVAACYGRLSPLDKGYCPRLDELRECVSVGYEMIHALKGRGF